MKKYSLFILLCSALGWAAGGPAGNIVQFSNNGTPTNVSPVNPLPVTGTISVGSSVTVTQGPPGPTSSPWPVTIEGSLPITLPTPLPVIVVTPKAPINPNGNLSARQTVTSTESNLSAPSAAVAVIIECESVNADNLRWGFSNSATNILSTTLGVLCEPGRSENIPIGQGSVLHMISTGASSDYMDIQWVLSQ